MMIPLIVFVLLIAAIGGWYLWAGSVGPDYARGLEWAQLTKSDKPNQYLVAPEGFTAATPDRVADTYGVDWQTLKAELLAVVYAEPRREIIWTSPDEREIVVRQHTAIMRYPDFISIQVIPGEEGGSTLAIYGRSHFGYSDMGVNAARVQRWLAALADRLAA